MSKAFRTLAEREAILVELRNTLEQEELTIKVDYSNILSLNQNLRTRNRSSRKFSSSEKKSKRSSQIKSLKKKTSSTPPSILMKKSKKKEKARKISSTNDKRMKTRSKQLNWFESFQFDIVSFLDDFRVE